MAAEATPGTDIAVDCVEELKERRKYAVFGEHGAA